MTRKEAYLHLREQVKTLKTLQGECATENLIAGLDGLWRAMLRVRKAMLVTLIERNDIAKPKDVDTSDFLALYLQIHNPRLDSRLCDGCLSSVEFGITTCPYCGTEVNGKTTAEAKSQVVIDFDLPDAAPDWNIDTDPTEILDKDKKKAEFDATPVLKPITKRDDIPGPKGISDRGYTKKPESLAKSTRKVLTWVRKKELGQLIPLSPLQLSGMKRQDLMAMLSLIAPEQPVEWWKQVWTWTRADVVQYVLANQGDKPRDPGPVPYGEVVIPDEEVDDGEEN